MTKFDEIANRPDHSWNWFAPDGLNSLALDGGFTKEQLLELIQAMENPDGDPVVYTEEMAAEDDELLANVPTPLSTSTGGDPDDPSRNGAS